MFQIILIPPLYFYIKKYCIIIKKIKKKDLL
nr:MAG TPA: hypothetical protein [Caudoviricetes sp.]